MTDVLVVGLGNRDRGDDRVGLGVVDALRGRSLDARLVEWTGAELDLLDLWDADDEVVIVDASSGAGPPGTISRLRLEDLLWGATPGFGATHAMGLQGVVQLAHRLGRLPRRLEVHTVEVDSTELGRPMSPTVREAATRVADELLRRYGRRRSDVAG